MIADAVHAGGRVRTGGRAVDGPGYFFEPTVIDGVDPACELVREEIFGPVAPVVAFEDEAEAICIANDTEYGLVSYLYTGSLDRALRVSEALKAGMVAVNRGLVSNAAAPFGGIKHSGLGREGGREGIEDYLDLKYICMDR